MKRKLIGLGIIIASLGTTALGMRDAENHWSKPYISDIAAKGILEGYPDGTFKPDNPITREEACAVLSRYIGGEIPSRTDHVSKDTKGRWSAKYVHNLIDRGVVYGYPDGTFRPTNNITKAEFAKLVATHMILKGIDNSGPKDLIFPDLSRHWAQVYVYKAAGRGFVTGNPDGTFRPDSPITRGEVSAIISRMLAYIPEPEPEPEKEFDPAVDEIIEDTAEGTKYSPRTYTGLPLYAPHPTPTGEIGRWGGAMYTDGWEAPVLKSKHESGMSQIEQYNIFRDELGFPGKTLTTDYPVREMGEPIRVGHEPERPEEIWLVVKGWRNDKVPESYRIPIILEELMKFYFEAESDYVFKLMSNTFTESFTANGRFVRVSKGDEGIRMRIGFKGRGEF